MITQHEVSNRVIKSVSTSNTLAALLVQIRVMHVLRFMTGQVGSQSVVTETNVAGVLIFKKRKKNPLKVSSPFDGKS